MSMNIGGIGSGGSYFASMTHDTGQTRRQRPDPSEMVDNLFSKLDSSGKGYLEKSDLVSAYENVGATSSTASVDDVFSTLDADTDGKVTKEEMATGIQKLAEQLDSAFNAMRMRGMPPPPPPSGGGKDSGLTQDEISSIASTTEDSKLAELMNNLAANFDKADSDGDGKVSVQEAMAFQAKQATTSSTSSTASTSGTDSTTAVADSTSDTDQSSTVDILRRILDLMRAYAPNTDDKSASLVSTLSETA
jgi:Ca2+-binding EF-hand superfamily protein